MPCVGAVCGVVWCRGLLCVRDALCPCCVRVGVCVLVCACWCVGVGVCWCVLWWCVWLCVVWCLLWCGTLKTSVCAFNTSPCVRSKRSRVYRQHAHMYKTCGHVAGTHVTFLTHTRGRVECTHGGGWGGREGGHRQFCSPKWHTWSVHLTPERFTKSNLWILPI